MVDAITQAVKHGAPAIARCIRSDRGQHADRPL